MLCARSLRRRPRSPSRFSQWQQKGLPGHSWSHIVTRQLPEEEVATGAVGGFDVVVGLTQEKKRRFRDTKPELTSEDILLGTLADEFHYNNLS